MNETQQRIAQYKKALPKMKERIIAVALLLAISIAMATTVSFAWLVLSKAPEVTGVSTTIAANGNLEIALASGPRTSLSAPGASQVGDSELKLLERNITWGNLINLTDPAYGLDNLVLRPAQLNRSALNTSPLYGAEYSVDGRIEKLTSSFGYATWQPEKPGVPGVFLITDDMGVRAISSVTIKAVGFAQQVLEKRTAAEDANLAAGASYLAITGNKGYMESLATIMGTYMTARMNSGQGDASLTNPTVYQKDVQNIRDVFGAMIEAYEKQLDAMVALANYQLFLLNNSESGSTPYTEYTAETLVQQTEASLKNAGITLSGLNTLKTDLAKLRPHYDTLQTLAEQGDIKWNDSGINNIVNDLMNVGTCTLDGTPVGNIGASNASGYLDGKVHSAVITNGVLYNFEHINGSNCRVEGLSVSAKVKRMGITIPASITVTITTSAPTPAKFATALKAADSLNKGTKGVEVAEDTYGLAVDFWVRTNAQSTYLILEGNVLTTSKEEKAMGKNANGDPVELFTLTRSSTDDSTGETVTFTYDLYKIVTPAEGDNPKTTTWYLHDNHSVFTLKDGEEPMPKMEKITTVIGYKGENRVWEDNTLLSPDATTQGAGSCYVYYADTPEDQARSLRLLEAFNVAFVDQYGNLLATAEMDTEHHFAESGRVTVPLVLQTDSINLGEDSQGVTTYAITPLEKNVPMLITALVYLDGTRLTNDEVLAAADIQGQLNIQFGSSVDLNAIDNEELSSKERSVSASVSKTTFDYDTATEPMTTTVTVNVTGDQPNTVTAFFLRKINDAQGSREEVMTFTKGEGGTWTADYTFRYPGKYVLRSVLLDGVEYDLPMSDATEVTVTGFTIRSLSVLQANNARHVDIMTAAGSSSVDVTLNFATNDPAKMPSTVAGRFLREDGTAANIAFTYNPTTGMWGGKTTFVTSGDYTLQYLVLNGEYVELPDTLWHTATVNLGMKVEVYTSSPTTFLYKPSDWLDDSQNLTEEGMKKTNLGMRVRILNNAGEEMPGMSGAQLNYSKTGTSIVQEGFNTNLTWNASTGYYEGTFQSKVGMYSFLNVSIGTNVITNATTSPNFKIISPEPPKFNSGDSPIYQFVPQNNAFLRVIIDECEAATVYADVVHTKGTATTEYEAAGSLVSGKWVFNLPVPASGSQDGEWTIRQLRLWDVYAADGTEYTEAAPLIFDMAGKSGVSSKVVHTVNITVQKPDGFDSDLGKNGDTITATFMDTHTVSGLSVVFTDYEGQPLVDETGQLLISDVAFVYAYGNDSVAKGGYTNSELTKERTYTVALTNAGDNKTFKQGSALSVQYAGTYTPTLSYEVMNVPYTMSAEAMGEKAPTFAVWSITPSVSIKEIGPTGTFSVDTITDGQMADTDGYNTTSTTCLIGWSKHTHYAHYWKTPSTHIFASNNTKYIPTIASNKYTASVYFKCAHADKTTYGGTGYYHLEATAKIADNDTLDYHEYTQPYVTITLSNKGNASDATLSFGTSAHVYASEKGTEKTNYSWTANGDAKRYIGLWVDNSGDDDSKTVAGTITANTLILTYDSVEYTVTVPTITINNPY